jgi:hypothetical protein
VAVVLCYPNGHCYEIVLAVTDPQGLVPMQKAILSYSAPNHHHRSISFHLPRLKIKHLCCTVHFQMH